MDQASDSVTAEYFEEKVGRPPVMDDLEKCNCTEQGYSGHTQCGWNKEKEMPVFMVGR